jgi:hypothetical protein
MIYDLTCPWCFAKQKIPAFGVPFRFYCGNCHDLLTYRGDDEYRDLYAEIQAVKRREPRWREIHSEVANRDGNPKEWQGERSKPFVPYEDRVKPF